ncbi:MAG: Ig-like domain-containing protein, partial [Lachnospiraceae bacterium]|nr:Ig-like domain-containing protein [Lachnospiraceae bacterium]
NKVTEWTVTGREKGKSYKGYVRAFVCSSKKGKRVYIGRGPLVHEYTSGGTKTISDAKKLTVESTDISLEKGDTYKINAKITKRDKKKKLFGHVDKFRYKSTNKGIASVSKDGNIKGEKAGTCYVYAYAHNGVHKRIKVTVK